MSCAKQSRDSGAFIATPSAKQSFDNGDPPQIFKLNVDCFEHLFEWLSLKQLLAFRRTCKRMKQVVDYYLKLNYSHLLRLSIYNQQRWVDFHGVHLNCFDWIKQLNFLIRPNGLTITVPEIESITYVLNRLEVLRLDGVRIIGNLYEVILKHCPLLKHLSVTALKRPDSINGTDNQWLFRQYPSLEHFELHAGARLMKLDCTTELMAFFKQNPQIRIFSTDSGFLDQLHRPMLDSNMKFDRLDIVMDHNLNWICDLANTLHENGFYERLHVHSKYPYSIENEEQCLSKLKNLGKLRLQAFRDYYRPIPVVESLKELTIAGNYRFPLDTLKMMAKNFINLRRVDMHFARLHDIRAFVCHAPKLRQIQVITIRDVEPLKVNDFVAMNEERRKLTGACKVKLLIEEREYLKCKWAANINFSLIELKRSDMYKACKPNSGCPNCTPRTN